MGQLNSLDSFQFMKSSLKKLVDATDKSSFKLTAQDFKLETYLILRKGVYRYKYIDSQERLKNSTFYSKLPDVTIS